MSRGGGPPVVEAAYEDARLALARLRVRGHEDRERALERTARICAQALEVDRVGVWFFDGPWLRGDVIYDRRDGHFTRRARLAMDDFPTYAAALRQRRAVVAPDARSDEVTRELTQAYLEPNGIGALLDAPLYVHGEVVGVVCHEHVSGVRHWTEREVDFASTVADMCASVLEQVARAEAEAALSEQAWQSSELHRLELLADLASAIAHDFNNVLASVGLVGETLARQEHPEVVAASRTLREAVDVGARLVGHLRALGQRDEAADAGTTVVASAVERLAHLLEPLMRATAKLHLEIDEHTARVAVDRTHVDQLLMNLCLNARDAVGASGRVTVRVRAPRPDEGSAEAWLAVDVEDDGAGVAPEDLPRVFEPYFTTKPEGSGQGLATVKRIVDAAGGQVQIDTEVGRGTRFTLLLPRA